MNSSRQPSQILMVIEDNPDDFEAIERGLRRYISNPLLHLHSGDAALDYLFRRGEHAQAPRPGLILLDLRMPGTDGYEVLRTIKEDPVLKVIPVVILTSSKSEEDIEFCYRIGANSYVPKRLNLIEFMQALERISDYWLEISLLPRLPD